MRKFSYKSADNANLRSLKEEKIKKNSWNIDRVIYYLIILIALFFLVRYVYIKLNIIKGDGLVTFDKIDVTFADDIRLMRLYVSEDDTVSLNDTLFSYTEKQFEDRSSTLYTAYKSDKARREAELESFKRDLDLEQIKLRSLAVMVKRYETEIEKVRKLVLLDVSSREKLDQLELTLFETRQEWEVSRSRVAFLQRNIEQTKSFINTPMSAFASGEAGGSGGDLYSRYVAPKAGVIGRIEYNPNEIVYKTNSVLAINNPDSIHVVGYFDPREIGYIGKGVRVKLIFPDKTEGWGVIVKYYIATYALPEEFQKKYEPTTRSIVTIIALENNDTNMLQRFFKMTVKLEINKFFWERSHAEKAVEAQPAASKDDLPEPAGQGKDEPEYSAENPIPALDANASDSTGN